MKNALIIAYYFPPSGGPGVQRPLYFSKYLPEYGYRPFVLTPKSALIRYVKDKGLTRHLPKEVRLFETFIIDLNWFFKLLYGLRLFGIVRYISNELLFPDYNRQWLPFAKRELKRIIKTHRIDVICITVPPFSLLRLAKWAHQKFDIPIVLDFRDSFTTAVLGNYAHQKKFALEQEALKYASHLIHTTTSNKKRALETFQIDDHKVTVITNGYDEQDFVLNRPLKAKKKACTLITYIGKLYGDYNVLPVLRVLSELENENMLIRFVGGLSVADKDYLKENPSLREVVEEITYSSHDRVLEYYRQTDILLLVLASSKFNYIIPGKVFEYIASGKPVLAIVPPEGEVAHIIRSSRTGVVVNPENPKGIREALRKMLAGNMPEFNPQKAEINRYSRKMLTKELARVFDSVSLSSLQ